jgi:hypothetical protein
MSKRSLPFGALAFLAIAGIAPVASATTIDTYDFSQGGYGSAILGGGTGVLTGSFTGVVEPDGFIERADVSSMSVTLAGVTIDGLPLFFSFDTAGGSSSLDFITKAVDSISACVGAVAEFGSGFGGCGPGGYNGIVGDLAIFPLEDDVTQDLPVVTLVSSVTTPEASTWAMMLLGFAGLGFAGYRQRHKPAGAASV